LRSIAGIIIITTLFEFYVKSPNTGIPDFQQLFPHSEIRILH
jgi:hypothetical protein